MAQALDKAMEFMGWRVPPESDDDAGEDTQPTAPTAREEAHAAPHPLRVQRERARADLRRIVTVHPTTFSDARTIGEAFREGTPVIMNLTDMSEGDARRVVDFAAGLSFGLHGVIERVTSRVFLLSPAMVEVSGDASTTRRGSLFNQS